MNLKYNNVTYLRDDMIDSLNNLIQSKNNGTWIDIRSKYFIIVIKEHI